MACETELSCANGDERNYFLYYGTLCFGGRIEHKSTGYNFIV